MTDQTSNHRSSTLVDVGRRGGLRRRVLFVCTGNAARSQMAEAWLRMYGGDYFDVQSAGTEPRECVDPLAVRTMSECGIDMSGQRPKDVWQFIAERWDFVAACGVFLYFPSLDYARAVLGRMARKASRGVLVLDVPDLAKHEATETARRRRIGDAAYAAKYAGLSHLYIDKAWFETALRELGFGRIRIEDQAITGYANAASRYNVFAWRDGD